MGLAVLNEWCGRMVGDTVPMLWTDIENNSTNTENCRHIIERTTQEIVRMQSIEISKYYLPGDMLKDLTKLDLTPGVGLSVISTSGE